MWTIVKGEFTYIRSRFIGMSIFQFLIFIPIIIIWILKVYTGKNIELTSVAFPYFMISFIAISHVYTWYTLWNNEYRTRWLMLLPQAPKDINNARTWILLLLQLPSLILLFSTWLILRSVVDMPFSLNMSLLGLIFFGTIMITGVETPVIKPLNYIYRMLVGAGGAILLMTTTKYSPDGFVTALIRSLSSPLSPLIIFGLSVLMIWLDRREFVRGIFISANVTEE